jgi:hypothetical protein
MNMAGLFGRKSRRSKLRFVDLEGQPLKEGDTVLSLRYDLGECRILNTEDGMVYESLATGEQVSYAKMIDAATGCQKVRKIS